MMQRIFAILVLVALAATGLEAGVKTKVTHDKTFDFSTVKTYAWHPDGIGEVKVLNATMGDDAGAVNKLIEPVVKEAVERELARKGFVPATSGAPDLHLHYYLLVGPEGESQYMGQFIGGTPEWGLPAFSVSTTGLTVKEHGTLVFDISLVSQKVTVWRGIATTAINRQRSLEQKKQRINEGITGMFKKFPPKYTGKKEQ